MKKTKGPPRKGAGGTSASPEAVRFPVVGLGASAGGLEALRQLFAHLPDDLGMGFVVIQHLDPDRPSMLTQVLEGVTRLQVVEAASGMRVEPNRVHVIPAGSDLIVREGTLELVRREKSGRLHLPIDAFFRSLAEDGKGRAIGVVLSGSGSDGTEGLRAIGAAGGITIAQEPESAQFRSMPESALVAEVVDFRGTPQQIAQELARLSHHPYVATTRGPAEPAAREPEPGEDRELAAILALVSKHAAIDFSGYKRTTVQRRIDRRMAVRHAGSLGDYARLLEGDPEEAKALAQDMLIHVTAFFRDPEAFEALKEHALRELVRRKTTSDSIRIWVPGCSTGEEAYAVTICLLEVLGGQAGQPSIKVFGSDLSERSIESARLGRYPEASLAGVAPERLARFFERTEGGYRISKPVRDLVVFVRHDLTRDPPFARLDLVSCRNVLIYFDTELQRRVIPMLHYCLSKQGYLFLGKSESITGFRDLFEPVDKEQRIFVKIGESPRLLFHSQPAGREAELKLSTTLPAERRLPAREAQSQADHLLLAQYAPPGVVVNDRLEVIQFRGRTGAYLEPAPGQPQTNVLKMAREGLAAHLHEAIERARAQASVVRKEGLRVRDGTATHVVNLEVIPLTALPDPTERHFLILFEEPAPASKPERGHARPPGRKPPALEAGEVERLKSELEATKEYLQSLVSEHQSNSDELAAANEELVSANEELQSTNEELQSAKEELQSTNEELGTVNDQLRSRNQELDEVASDLVNVLASVEIPVVIVDLQLRVRRFTPTVRQVARFIPEDVGRPIEDLKLKLRVGDLPARIKSVIEGLSPREWEVQDEDGRWYRMQIRPYRAADDRLDGAVLSFVDVDALKNALTEAEAARDFARNIVETVTSALVVLDSKLQVVSANDAFHQMFGLPGKTAEAKGLFELGGGVLDQAPVHQALEDALGKLTHFGSLELDVQIPRGGSKRVSLSGRPILRGGSASLVLLAIDDVTTLRALETERARILESERQARIEAERANRAKDLFLATLSHELRTPLATMLMSAQLLRRAAAQDGRLERASASIERSAKAQARLIDDLLDVSRIVSGKLLLDLGPVDLAEVVREAVDIARSSAEAKAQELTLSIEGTVGLVYGDAARLLQVVNNLLTNAVKFTPHGGKISVRLGPTDGQARLTVTDTGAGIRPEVLPHLFSRFVQADSSVTRTHGGLGLGLSIVRHLVEVHRGEVHAESPGEGKGSTFTVTLPLGLTAEEKATAAVPRGTTRDIRGVRVLLVEDDDDTRQAYAAMLAELGAEVCAVPSAATGLAAMEKYQPQVILSDIAMPGEDGYSFIQKVRRREPERGGRVPAAALTALAGDEDRKRAMESGFQLHAAKPIDASRLATIVGMLAAWNMTPPRPEATA